jgi:hypothetical protein
MPSYLDYDLQVAEVTNHAIVPTTYCHGDPPAAPDMEPEWCFGHSRDLRELLIIMHTGVQSVHHQSLDQPPLEAPPSQALTHESCTVFNAP